MGRKNRVNKCADTLSVGVKRMEVARSMNDDEGEVHENSNPNQISLVSTQNDRQKERKPWGKKIKRWDKSTSVWLGSTPVYRAWRRPDSCVTGIVVSSTSTPFTSRSRINLRAFSLFKHTYGYEYEERGHGDLHSQHGIHIAYTNSQHCINVHWKDDTCSGQWWCPLQLPIGYCLQQETFLVAVNNWPAIYRL